MKSTTPEIQQVPQSYSIGQLAQAAGVPTSTVRFYERAGIIKPDFRTGGNYRGYTAASMERLRFVRSAQSTGLSLQDVRALLQLTHSSKLPCAEVLSLMRRRLEEIRGRLKDLRQVERVLSRSLEACCKGNERDICRDVCRLSGADAAVSKKKPQFA